MKKGKILIVDDNEDILFTLKLLLRPLAESVTLLSDPRELLPRHFPYSFRRHSAGHELPTGCRQWKGRIPLAGRDSKVGRKSRRHLHHSLCRYGKSRASHQTRCYKTSFQTVAERKTTGHRVFCPATKFQPYGSGSLEEAKGKTEKTAGDLERTSRNSLHSCRTDKSNRGVGCHARHFPDHPQIFRHRRQPPATGRKRNGKGFDCQICLRTIAPEKGSVCADRLGKHPRNIVRKRALRL